MIKFFLSATFLVSFFWLDTVEGMEEKGRDIVSVNSSSALVKRANLKLCPKETTKTKRTAPITWNTESADSDDASLGPLFKTGLKDSDVVCDDSDDIVVPNSNATAKKSQTLSQNGAQSRRPNRNYYNNLPKETSSAKTAAASRSKTSTEVNSPKPTDKMVATSTRKRTENLDKTSIQPKRTNDIGLTSRSKNSNNNLPRETPPTKTAAASRPKTSTAVNSPKPTDKMVATYTTLRTKNSDETSIQSKRANDISLSSRSKNSNNNLPKEMSPAKTAAAPRSKTSTAVNSPKQNAQKVNIYSSSWVSNSNNNLQNKTPSTKPTAAILPRTSTNNNTSRFLNSNTGNNNRNLRTSVNKNTIQPRGTDTQTTSQKNSSYKYKTNDAEIRTTPKKNTTLSPKKPTPANKMKIKEKLPAPLPEPEFIEVMIPVDHWNKSTFLRSGFWDYAVRYETVKVKRGETPPTRKLLNSDWSFDKYKY